MIVKNFIKIVVSWFYTAVQQVNVVDTQVTYIVHVIQFVLAQQWWQECY